MVGIATVVRSPWSAERMVAGCVWNAYVYGDGAPLTSLVDKWSR
jgi:hypothetical protein